MLLHLEKRGCGTHLLCRLPLCTNVDPKCTSLCFRTSRGTQDSRATKTNVIDLLYEWWVPVAFTRQVCNACTLCCAWNAWFAMLVLYVMLETNGVQCLYYMFCLKQMVCNDHSFCSVWNEWCAMLVLYVMLEMSVVQWLYYVLCLEWMVCNVCTMYCIHFDIQANVCTCIIHVPWARAK